MHLFKTKRGKIGHALQLNQYAESDIILVAKVLLLKINLIFTRAEKILLHLFDQSHDRLTTGKLWTVSWVPVEGNKYLKSIESKTNSAFYWPKL